MQGPVARIVAVIIIIATGFTLAFGDSSGGFRRLIQIVFGLSIAFAASSFFLSFFSFSGGAGWYERGATALPPGFEAPLYRALTEPILLGGAPRTVAIANGTLAAAIGLGLQLWVPGLACFGSPATRWRCGARAWTRSSCRCSRATSSSGRCWTCRAGRAGDAEPR